MTDDDQQREVREAEALKNEIRQYFQLLQSDEGTINPEQASQIALAFGYKLDLEDLNEELRFQGDLNAKGVRRGNIKLDHMYNLIPNSDIVSVARREQELKNALMHFRRGKEDTGVDVEDLKTALLSSGFVNLRELNQIIEVLELPDDYVEIQDIVEKVFMK